MNGHITPYQRLTLKKTTKVVKGSKAQYWKKCFYVAYF
jgi:hypothetical protein